MFGLSQQTKEIQIKYKCQLADIIKGMNFINNSMSITEKEKRLINNEFKGQNFKCSP